MTRLIALTRALAGSGWQCRRCYHLQSGDQAACLACKAPR